LFSAFGRHPIAGLATAFAGVAAGFSANLLITSLDPLLSGLTMKAAQTLDVNYVVQPTANYYFMFLSTFVLTAVGAFVTTKIVEPRLGPWKGTAAPKDADNIAAKERSGLMAALWVTIAIVVAIVLLTVPSWAP